MNGVWYAGIGAAFVLGLLFVLAYTRRGSAGRTRDGDSSAAAAFFDGIKSFDAITACKAMDERLSELAAKYPTGNR